MYGLLYADDLVLCGESEESLRAMMRRFVEIRRRRGLIINVGKSKMMVLGRRRIAGAIRSLVNARSLKPECAKVLPESWLVPVLTYGSETKLRKEKDLALGLYRWTTSEVCLVSGRWIESGMHG